MFGCEGDQGERKRVKLKRDSTHTAPVVQDSTLFSETPTFTGVLSTNPQVYLALGFVLEPQLRSWKMENSGDPQI